MISIRNKPQKTTKKVTRQMNMTEKSIEIARDRGLGTDDLLKYDVVPSPMLFDGGRLMNKPEKSQLIRELEDKLKPDDYSYHHQPESAFLVDVMAVVRRVPLTVSIAFSMSGNLGLDTLILIISAILAKIQGFWLFTFR